jgi:hypothetical protein
MSRRLAVLGLVVLVTLSGCAGPFGDADTPTPTETDSTGATTTSAETAAATTETTETDDTVSGDVPAGVDDDGTLSDPGALIDAHTRALEETGYETSTNVRVEPQSGGETQVIEYRALVEQGSTPFWIEVNTSVGGELASHQTIWGNDSVRYRRVRQPTGTGNVSAQYDRQSQGSPSIDPGIRAYEQVLAAGDFRMAGESEEGTRLVAEQPREDAISGDLEIESYSGDLVVDDQNRIRRAEIEMSYVDARGQERVATIQYRIDRQDGVTAPEPAWIETASAQTRDVAIDARAVDDTHIAITNVGSDPISADARFAVAASSGAAVLELDESIAPGETVYIYNPEGGKTQIGREEPTGDLSEFTGTYRVVLQDPDGNRIATVDVEFD